MSLLGTGSPSVTTNSTQTLTNKSLTSPVLTTPSFSGTATTGLTLNGDLTATNVLGNNKTTAYYYGQWNYSTTQSVTSNVLTILSLDTEVSNPSSMTKLFTSGNMYIQLPLAGKWKISVRTYAYMTPTTGTFEGLYLYTCTGTPNLGSDTTLSAFETRFTSQTVLQYSYTGSFNANDKVYMGGLIQGTSPSFSYQASNYQKTNITIELVGL